MATRLLQAIALILQYLGDPLDDAGYLLFVVEVYQLLQRSGIVPPAFLQGGDVGVGPHPLAEEPEKVHALQVGWHVAAGQREADLFAARDQELQQSRQTAQPRRLHEIDRTEIEDDRIRRRRAPPPQKPGPGCRS